MTWLLHDQSLEPIVAEIEKEVSKQSDRGVGVIAGGLIEKMLLEALKSRLRQHTQADKKTAEDLFGIARPLASFSAKIDLGLLLGLYKPEVHKDLHRVRDVRNKFAHVLECRDFNYPVVVKNCDSFWIPHNLFIVDTATPSPPSYPTDPRARFIWTVKLLLTVLSRAIKNPQRPCDPLWG